MLSAASASRVQTVLSSVFVLAFEAQFFAFMLLLMVIESSFSVAKCSDQCAVFIWSVDQLALFSWSVERRGRAVIMVDYDCNEKYFMNTDDK